MLPPCLFDSVVRLGWCLSLVAWRMRGFLGSCSLPFILSLDWALLGWRPSSSCWAHVPFFPMSIGLLAMDLAIPPHWACYSITSLFISCYPWTYWLMLLLCQPTSLSFFCACSISSEFVSAWPSHHFCCLRVCLILLYVLVGVYLLWREGCVGFWAHVPCISSLLWTGHCLGEGLHLPVEPMFLSFLCPWASCLWILPYLFIVLSIALPLFLFLVTHGLTSWCSCRASPLLYHSFAQGFLGPFSTFLPLLGFIGQHSYCASPFLYFIPRASSAHLLILYLFSPMDFLLNPLGFLNPISTSLPLITSWVYWPLS